MTTDMNEIETCEDCGFAWELVPAGDVGPRVATAVEAIVNEVREQGDAARVRPTPARWSSVEYAAHVRDVLLTIRDRLVLGIVEDQPDFKPLYREERVNLGLYAGETIDSLAVELPASAAMFARVFAAVPADQLGRLTNYGFPKPVVRSLLWLGQQAVHETEHHLGDIREDQPT